MEKNGLQRGGKLASYREGGHAKDKATRKKADLTHYAVTGTPLSAGSIGIDVPSVAEASTAASTTSRPSSIRATAPASRSVVSSTASIFADTSPSPSVRAGATERKSGSAGDGTGEADLDLFVTVSKSFFPALPESLSALAVLLLLPPRAFCRLLPLLVPPVAAPPLPPDLCVGRAFERFGWCLSLQSSQYHVPIGATLCPMQIRWN